MTTSLDELISGGRGKWAEEYKKLFGLPISDVERFHRCVDLYGPWIMLDAMVASAPKKFDKDPLGYIIAVAHAKWKAEQEERMSAERYEIRIKIAQERSLEYGQQLSEKIEKARRKMKGKEIGNQ